MLFLYIFIAGRLLLGKIFYTNNKKTVKIKKKAQKKAIIPNFVLLLHKYNTDALHTSHPTIHKTKETDDG